MSETEATWSKPLFITGTFLSAFSAGFTASISVLSIPALLEAAPPQTIANIWRIIYDRGKVLGPTVGLLACAAHLSNAYIVRRSSPTRSNYFVVAGITSIAIAPFTGIFMAPTNNQLISISDGAGTVSDAVELARTWGTLNLIRAAFPAVGALFGYMAG